jgi:hypothetical protein
MSEIIEEEFDRINDLLGSMEIGIEEDFNKIAMSNVMAIKRTLEIWAEENETGFMAKIVLYVIFAEEKFVKKDIKKIKPICLELLKEFPLYARLRFGVAMEELRLQIQTQMGKSFLTKYSKKLLEPLVLNEYPLAMFYLGGMTQIESLSSEVGSFIGIDKSDKIAGLSLMEKAAANMQTQCPLHYLSLGKHFLELTEIEERGYFDYDIENSIDYLQKSIFWIYLAVICGCEDAENTIAEIYYELNADEMLQNLPMVLSFLPGDRFIERQAKDLGIKLNRTDLVMDYEYPDDYWESFFNTCLVNAAKRGFKPATDYLETLNKEDLKQIWPELHTTYNVVLETNVIPFSKDKNSSFNALIGFHNTLHSDQNKKRDNILKLIEKGEGIDLEFKETFSFDTKTKQKKSNHIRFAAIREICSFLNTEGGTLLIGVSDQGNIVGIEKDGYNKDWDKYHRTITQLILQSIGAHYSNLVDVEKVEIDKKSICIITCSKSETAVYCNFRDKKNLVFVRTGSMVITPDYKEWDDWQKRYF